MRDLARNEISEVVKDAVSVILVAFNQQTFVAAAVASALGQAHEPLEIILSDDASSDGTFAEMREIVAQYRGPHRVILNQNKTNLGIARHIQFAAELATGSLIVVQAGDDISEPSRVKNLLGAWVARGRPTAVLHSRLSAMNSQGVPTETPEGITSKYFLSGAPIFRIIETTSGVNGATMAWTRNLCTTIWPISEKNALEDTVLPFRAALVGGELIFVDAPLVRYRTGVSTWIANASEASNADLLFARVSRFAHCQRDSLRQILTDLGSDNTRAELREYALAQYVFQDFIVAFSQRPGLASVVSTLARRYEQVTFRILKSSTRFIFPKLYAAYWRWKHHR